MKKIIISLFIAIISLHSHAEEIILDCVVDGNIITPFDKTLIYKQHVTVEISDSSELYGDPKISPTFISVLGSDDLAANVWSWESPKNKSASLIVNNSTKNKYDIKTVIRDDTGQLEQTVVINRATRLLTVSKNTRLTKGNILVTYSGPCQKAANNKF